MSTNFFDVVIVGAGNAALCGAIAARENGASVLILEKGPEQKRGGNSYFTDGAIRLAFDSLADLRVIMPHMTDEQADKIVLPPYTADDYRADFQRITQGKTDTTLSNILIDNSYETMVWLHGHKIQFDMIYDNQSFVKDGKYHFWGGLVVKSDGRGIGLIKGLFARAKELGIEVWYNAAGTELSLNDAGQIESIQVLKDGQSQSVQTKSVVLACGSYEGSMKKRIAQMGSEWEKAILRGTEFNTGDGIDMALAVGAVKYGDWQMGHAISTDANAPTVGDFEQPGDIFKKSSYPIGLIINKEGKRFVDEGADFRNYTYAKYGREVLKQTDSIAYHVFDGQVADLLRSEYREEICTKFESDTLEGLVDQMDVDGVQFMQTIHEYNLAVQDGEFNPQILDGKGAVGITPPKSNWANTIAEPPFLAFPVTCGLTFAFGGVKVTTSAQVVNEEGAPIPGLFAAGEMVGGLFYHNYPGGSGLASGAVFGRIAGTSAARYCQAGTTQKEVGG
ncbi:MAG: FAD-dependent tricarballylate dehydrogenase TcuA [Chloroflexota bacterium]